METERTLRPRPIADLTPENLRTIVEDIGGPGWYTSAALYAWYVGMCQEEKLEPVTHRKFGGVLRELGYKTSIRRVAGKHSRCWFITRRALREGEPRG
jgi:hypothetical protein